jgi:Protein of unknwon function (DUF3008)
MPGGKARPKAVSEAQQKVAGMAHAIQQGKMKPKPGTPSAEMAKTMGKADTKSMASTPHAGLPVNKIIKKGF